MADASLLIGNSRDRFLFDRCTGDPTTHSIQEGRNCSEELAIGKGFLNKNACQERPQSANLLRCHR